jgi:hypothetical protein
MKEATADNTADNEISDGRASEMALFYRCNLEPKASLDLDGYRLQVQLPRRIQLLGALRYEGAMATE